MQEQLCFQSLSEAALIRQLVTSQGPAKVLFINFRLEGGHATLQYLFSRKRTKITLFHRKFFQALFTKPGFSRLFFNCLSLGECINMIPTTTVIKLFYRHYWQKIFEVSKEEQVSEIQWLGNSGQLLKKL